MGRYSLDDPRSQPEFRFWNKVSITNECWEWLGHKSRLGYGCFYFNPMLWMQPAHRASWMLTFGEIPKGRYVLHHCDNRSCVRTDHLYLGTQKDNMRDRKNRGNYKGSRGEKNGISKLTTGDISEIRNLVESGATFRSLAPRYNVNESTISRAAQGHSWTHI